MGGRKLEMAKRAAIEIVNRLHDGDEIALTIFDDVSEVLLPRTSVDDHTRIRFRELISRVDPRGYTALHDGWVRGAQAIAPEGGAASGRVVRCYLLTDGKANHGVTDPEVIANDVAAARAEFGVVTSTFGIGDYDEDILAPMATAGGGQFHNLRDTDEIVSTFLGELGEAVSVEVSAVAVEVDHDVRGRIDSVSGLWVRDGRRSRGTESGGRRTTILDVGDLVGAENRTIIVGIAHPAGEEGAADPHVRVRVTWRVPGSEATGASDWHEVSWAYADHEACEREPVEASVARDAGLHIMHRARRESSRSSRDGYLVRSRATHAEASALVARFVASSPDLADAFLPWDADMAGLDEAPVAQRIAKESISEAERILKGRRDMRGRPTTPTS